MMRMRNIAALVALLAGCLALTSCGVSLTLGGGSAAYADDLYGVHDRAALAAAEAEIAAREVAAREASEKRIAAMVAAAQAEDDIDAILGNVEVGGSYASVSTSGSSGNVSIYNNIYVDDYSSAYARRLQGFSSLTYRMPSSYYDYRYGDSYFLTLAYDPAFYTVMVVGDQVWVEPRYITNMFGSWNNPYYYGYRYGYNPYYYGYSYGYYDPWCWNSPYWGCDPYYHYYSHHYWHGPHYGHHHNHYHPGYHNPVHKPGGPGHHGGNHKPVVQHRPSYGTTGGSSARPGGGRLSYSDRLGGSTITAGSRGNDRGATQLTGPVAGAGGGGNRGGNTAIVGGSSTRPGTTVTNGRPGGTPTVTPNNDRGNGGSSTTPTTGRGNGAVTSGGVRGGVAITDDLAGSLSGSTIPAGAITPLRGNTSTGVSNSSSRGSAGNRATSTSSSSSSRKSSGVRLGTSSGRAKVNSSSTSSSNTKSTRSTSTRSSSTSSRSSSVSSSSRSSSSRSSFSSGSSSRSSSSSSSSRGGRGR